MSDTPENTRWQRMRTRQEAPDSEAGPVSPHDYRTNPRREGMADGGPCYFLGCGRESFDPIHLTRLTPSQPVPSGLDRDALYRRIHALPGLVHHGKGEQCFPITDAVLAVLAPAAEALSRRDEEAALIGGPFYSSRDPGRTRPAPAAEEKG